MKVLFLTISTITDIKQPGIYTDLLRQFIENNHSVSIITAKQKREGGKTELIDEENLRILRVRTGNITKTKPIEKAISQMLLENQYIEAIKKFFKNEKFDIVLYATPPITFEKVIRYVKKRDLAKSYLLLKDIFPQNAVDLNLIKKNGPIYHFFRRKERKLYQVSDYIGCMSQKNIDYLLSHNSVNPTRVEINPNSIDVNNLAYSSSNRVGKKKKLFRKKYGILDSQTIYIYGGNLGKPQGLDFFLEFLTNSNKEKSFFVIVGSGTESKKVTNFISENRLTNVLFLDRVSRDEYNEIEMCSDVGLVFLDRRFSIPNIPSRILGYMEKGLPVIAATDTSTDLKEMIESGGFGRWSEHGNIDDFSDNIELLYDPETRDIMGKRSNQFLKNHFSVQNSYEIIMKHFN
ncbi:glycosyltransferase family 4 protein [Enterococcus faecium]|nr:MULTISPECIES: glycosyltransferase family 4 protein [Enterococcus]EGP4970771.1 glycosyltransferase family 4 protein [Enterococcus faecium]MBX4243241.1 glycosyltransferase family 4 protein [Enterococcus lactis]MBX4247725.1 glycosyltransferase family 4 protein [Enterococcus lactis]RXW68783.1 glycosyltransferase WbuB [Enterococcus faecium]WOV58162.1 glycosyltransferase family 4 protein [Enterococcus faecium]